MKVGLNLVNLQTKKIEAQSMNRGSTASKSLSFTGNNMNQIAHVVPEFASKLFKGGGVADVIYDIATVFPKLDPTKEHAFFMPFYNADYHTDANGNLIMNPVKYGGKEYIVSDSRDISALNGNVNKFEVSHVGKSAMETIDSAGKSVNVDAHIYQINADELLASLNVDPSKVKVYATLTPGTGTMDKQYGFSYKDGGLFRQYSESARGSVDGVEMLHKIDPNFDPAHVMFHDVHGTAGMAHIQNKADSGSQLFKNMNLIKVIHNDGEGFQCEGASSFDMFSAYATPKQVQTLVGSQEYLDAVKAMPTDHGKALENLVKSLMPGLVDDRGNLSPALIEYVMGKGEDGVAKAIGVSDPYVEEICTIPEMTGGLSSKLKALREEGKLKGIINGSEFPDESKFIEEALFNPHNAGKIDLKYSDGTVVDYLKTYNPREIATIEDIIEKVLPVKEHNQYKFFERFIRRNDIVAPAELPKWTPAMAISGLVDKPAPEVFTTIDESFLEKLKGGITEFGSWARGGLQKDPNSMFLAFKKHIIANPDSNAVFVAGYSLGTDDNSKAAKAVLDEMMGDPLFKNRLLFLDGWIGPHAMTSGSDFSNFGSSFEPCGLTVPIAMAKGSIPLVTKTGGQQAMVQDGVNGMTTETSYFKIGKAEIAKTGYADEFKKAYDALIKKQTDAITEKASRFIRQGVDAPKYTPDAIEKMVEQAKEYKTLLNKYRIEIMSDEQAALMDRAVKMTKEEKLAMMLEGFKSKDKLSWNASFKEYNEFLWQDAPKDVTKAGRVIDTDALRALKPATVATVGGSVDFNAKGIEDAITNGTNSIKETLEAGFNNMNQGSEKGLKGFIENLPFKGKIAAAAGATALLATAVWAVIARENNKKEEEKEKAVNAAVYVPSVPVNTFVKNA